MDIHQLIETGNYIDEFKKEKVIFRKYSDLGLMIIKRKYGSNYSEDKSWLNYCRGIIIDYKEHKVVFIPPSKSKEVVTREVFLEEGNDSMELVDGTMINLFWFNGEWLSATRSNIGCTNKWSQDMNFLQMFQECSKDLDYTTLNKEYTYSFVMRHKKNRITSVIVKNELVLVEVYHKLSKLDELPGNAGYRVVNKNNDVVGLQKGLTSYRNGCRYKWLTTEHKFLEMIKPNTNNTCLNYLILRNSGHLTNFLQLLPEKRFEFEGYRKTVHNITQLLHQYYTNVFIHKEIDKKDIPFALRPLIYEIHGQYLKDKQGISWSHVKQYIYDLEPKRLQFVINNL